VGVTQPPAPIKAYDSVAPASIYPTRAISLAGSPQQRFLQPAADFGMCSATGLLSSPAALLQLLQKDDPVTFEGLCQLSKMHNGKPTSAASRPVGHGVVKEDA
jgi:hypothetical protein